MKNIVAQDLYIFRKTIFQRNIFRCNLNVEVKKMEKKKTLFTMKVEETDKGITMTCEGDACKDIVEKMKKGEIKLGTHYGCCTPTICCIPVEREEKSEPK